MRDYDVIVLGAGPAGSTCALLLARAGARVLVMERARLPRDKPCGGGVTLRASSWAPLDLAPVVERTVYGARFSLALGPHFDRWHPLPLTYMTRRARLDAFLAGAAAESGADLHDGEAALALETDGTGVTVRSARAAYRAGAVVGADGANGLASRVLGARDTYEEAVALEGNASAPDTVLEEWRELVALDLGGLAGGYGWVFPKGDHLNVGVGAWKYAASTLRPKLEALCHRYGLSPANLWGLRGHHLPLRRPGSPLARGPVLLVGDAAGLVDPLSGEGIHMAFLSARLAAEALMSYLEGRSPDLQPYVEAVRRLIGPELELSRDLHEAFHFAPPPYVALLARSEHFWRLFCRLIRGEVTYQGLVRMLGPLRPLLRFFGQMARRRREARVASALGGRPPAPTVAEGI
ncbi:MAG TPA: geranylgeranyl reductase family protein [Dehalococcoidia bacterium]|nr:geranylgeranyl reductase family protein [Dehalococcoidia bacterium]